MKTESSVGAYSVFPTGNPLLEVFKALNCCWGHLPSSAPILTGCICTAESLVLSHLSEVGGAGGGGGGQGCFSFSDGAVGP